MAKAVMAILHWDGDPVMALQAYERAVADWRARFPDRSEPEYAIAGRSEHGGLVVVNVFQTNQDHLAFGRAMGEPLAAVGLSTPEVEHVSVRRLGWPGL
jgi:hypothetical protein